MSHAYPPHRPETMSCQNASNDCSVLVTIYGSISSLSVVVCLVAVIQVRRQNLHRLFIYRLAVYQVAGSLSFAVWGVCQFFLLRVDYKNGGFCIAIAFLIQVSLWWQLLFSLCVTLHLFVFVVFYRDLKMLEPWYLGISVLVALSISIVPLITKTYGPSPAWCWITNAPNTAGYAEQLGVWLVPAFAALCAESVALVFMMGVLCRRTYWRMTAEKNLIRDKHKKALQQLLPLVAYPLLFCVLVTPPLVTRAIKSSYNIELLFFLLPTAICVPLWSLLSGLALSVHIAIFKMYQESRSQNRPILMKNVVVQEGEPHKEVPYNDEL